MSAHTNLVTKSAVWAILEPTIRAGETYTLPLDMSRAEALAYWLVPGHEVFVADEGGDILGTYFLQANQRGGGAHVANCGYVTAPWASGRGIARAMCGHSLDRARVARFYRHAVQFCGEHERTRRPIMAKLRIRDRRSPAKGVSSPEAGIG